MLCVSALRTDGIMHCLFCAAFTALCTVCLCSAHWWDDAPSILCCIHCIMHCVSVRYVLMGWCTVYFVLHSLHNALCTMWIVLYCTARCLLLPRVCSFALKELSVSTTLLHYVAFKYNLPNFALKKNTKTATLAEPPLLNALVCLPFSCFGCIAMLC